MIRAGIVLAALLAPAAAQAHSWFPWSCCNKSDCYEIGGDMKEPAPTSTPDGWRLHDGVVVPFRQARKSPDGNFYVCRRGGNKSEPIIHPSGELPCLFVPEMGF